MVREIVKANNLEGEKFLTERSIASIIKEDQQLYIDLTETAEAHRENCVGLSAVQIGEHKRAVVVLINDKFELFVNPVIINKSAATYETEEGCLSLDGTRKVTRHKNITILFTTRNGKSRRQRFAGITAQILQKLKMQSLKFLMTKTILENILEKSLSMKV